MPFFMHEGVKLHYEVEGAGFPLILHTGGGGDGSMWRDGGYVAGLHGFQYILFDHRGHGRSEKPRDPGGYGIEHFAGDVVALLDELSIERAAYWGYSFGADVGYVVATTAPERIAALIIQGSTAESDCDSPEEQQWRETFTRRVLSEGMGYLVQSFESEGQAMSPWFRKHMLDTDVEAFAYPMQALDSWHGPHALLPAVRCPALMLNGELEDPTGAAPRSASQMANARSVTFPGLDHITAYEHSELVLAEVIPFLNSLHLSAHA